MPGTPITNPADVSVAMPGNSLIPQGPLRSQNIGPDLSPQNLQLSFPLHFNHFQTRNSESFLPQC
jgi:hypothetical protein